MPGTFDEAIARHGPRLYALCRRLCGKEWEAQDLYQETWLRAWRCRQKYDPARPFEAWLCRICVNPFRDTLRRRAVLQFFPFVPESPDAPPLPAPSDDRDEYAALHAAVRELPTPQRLAVTLYYFCDKDIRQTALLLGVPEGTVKSRLAKARATLKRRLETDG